MVVMYRCQVRGASPKSAANKLMYADRGAPRIESETVHTEADRAVQKSRPVQFSEELKTVPASSTKLKFVQRGRRQKKIIAEVMEEGSTGAAICEDTLEMVLVRTLTSWSAALQEQEFHDDDKDSPEYEIPRHEHHLEIAKTDLLCKGECTEVLQKVEASAKVDVMAEPIFGTRVAFSKKEGSESLPKPTAEVMSEGSVFQAGELEFQAHEQDAEMDPTKSPCVKERLKNSLRWQWPPLGGIAELDEVRTSRGTSGNVDWDGSDEDVFEQDALDISFKATVESLREIYESQNEGQTQRVGNLNSEGTAAELEHCPSGSQKVKRGVKDLSDSTVHDVRAAEEDQRRQHIQRYACRRPTLIRSKSLRMFGPDKRVDNDGGPSHAPYVKSTANHLNPRSLRRSNSSPLLMWSQQASSSSWARATFLATHSKLQGNSCLVLKSRCLASPCLYALPPQASPPLQKSVTHLLPRGSIVVSQTDGASGAVLGTGDANYFEDSINGDVQSAEIEHRQKIRRVESEAPFLTNSNFVEVDDHREPAENCGAVPHVSSFPLCSWSHESTRSSRVSATVVATPPKIQWIPGTLLSSRFLSERQRYGLSLWSSLWVPKPQPLDRLQTLLEEPYVNPGTGSDG